MKYCYLIIVMMLCNGGAIGQAVYGSGSSDPTNGGAITSFYTDDDRAAVTGIAYSNVNESTLTYKNSSGSFTTNDQVIVMSFKEGESQDSYVFAEVIGVGTNTITINRDLFTGSPSAFWEAGIVADPVQIIKVGEYGSFTLCSTCEVLCHPAYYHATNGFMPGGVICFKVNGTLTIEKGAEIDANSVIQYGTDGGQGGTYNNALPVLLPGSGASPFGLPGGDAFIDASVKIH